MSPDMRSVRSTLLGCTELIRRRVKAGEDIDAIVDDIQRKIITRAGEDFGQEFGRRM